MVVTLLANLPYNIIDPHLHFFDKSEGEYAWLLSNNPPFWPDKSIINNNFSPVDLLLKEDCRLVGAVHIEAGFDNINPNREIEFLESNIYTKRPDTKFKSIGLIDVLGAKAAFNLALNKLNIHSTFVGVRCIFEDDADLFAEMDNLQENLLCLKRERLIFEFQANINNTALIEPLLKVLTSIPELLVVINHAGMPAFNDLPQYKVWKKNMKRFAELPMCFVKCSGFEMVNRAYTYHDVSLVLSSVAELFGHDRMMLASNFPLTLFSCSYLEYWERMIKCAENLRLPIIKVLCTNAKDLYQVD